MKAIETKLCLLATMLLFLLLRLPDVRSATLLKDNRSLNYTWNTGSWGSCYSPKMCGEGRRDRKVWCTDSSGFVVDDSNCKESGRPDRVQECFRVCEEHKPNLRWSIGRWSPCTPLSKASNSPCLGTQQGISSRRISCLYQTRNKPSKPVDTQACEYFWDKPVSSMACSVDCPQDCVVAKKNFSCSSCDGKSNVQQMMEIIVAPTNGGQPCLILENSTCPSNLDSPCPPRIRQRPKKYFLKLGQWQQCKAQPHSMADDVIQVAVVPRIGISERSLTCVDVNGHVSEMKNCNPDGHSLPSVQRRCVVPQDCEVSPWGEWRVVTEGCVNADGKVFPEVRTRSRTLVQMPLTAGARPCPPLYEKRIVDYDLPLCYKYKWVTLMWSDCEVRLHSNHGEVVVVKPTCGSGLQYRNLTCLRISDLAPVSEDHCKDSRPDTIQRCEIPCKRNCQVSSWSRWGTCLAFNNTDFMQPLGPGYRTRSRSVLVNPSQDGMPCPHLQEIETCKPIEVFGWKYGAWSECVLSDPEASCGVGTKSRDFTCVNYQGVTMASTFMCDHYFHDDVTKECTVPCPNDCLLSRWSDSTTCSQPCVTKTAWGEKEMNRTVLAIAGKDGAQCDRKRLKMEDCNLSRCEGIKWKAEEWGPCLDRKSANDIQPPCGAGVQTRKVHCERHEEYGYKLCKYIAKPDTERDCELPCPVDCVLTNFSDWRTCDADCNSDSVQTRNRSVLQPALHGGRPCPEGLVEARPCSPANEIFCLQQQNKARRSTYTWSTGQWSDCILVSKKSKNGVGFQIRNVSCVDENGQQVEPHHCLEPLDLTKLFNVTFGLPHAIRACEAVGFPICVMSHWTAWTDCGFEYQPKRYRHRELVGSSATSKHCNEIFTPEMDQMCAAMEPPVVKNSLWMSCIVEDNNRTFAVNGRPQRLFCGEGYRYKTGMQLEDKTKMKLGIQKDLCLVDCPIDCQMSEWSEWTPCDVPCGHGFRERERHVVVPANELGRPCPATVNKTETQREVCSIQCSNFYWFTLGWSDCHLSDEWSKQQCGDGKKYRTAMCFDKRTESEVGPGHCDPLLKPEVVSDCRIYCPGECVVSPWVTWKECSEPCSPENFKEVRRTILRKPGPGFSPCGAHVSRAPCVLNVTCHTHSWGFGTWGTCILPQGALCGEGVQERPLMCIRSDGRQVDAIQCEKNHKPLSLQEPISKPCYVDCPIDCVLSEWSVWNEVECSSCGVPSAMTRKRYVLQPPSDAGQPCPPEVEQSKPCGFKPCYHWKHSEWSNCDLEEAHCGYGLRTRLVECIRYDGLQVSKSYCLTVNITFPLSSWIDPSWLALAQSDNVEEEICHVPCPGDCKMSNWTDWSNCHRNCRIGQIVGYQTSSRVMLSPSSGDAAESCPHLQWKTRPCWDGDCDYFQWKLKNGSYVCQSKDGLVVEDGCTSSPKPCSEDCDKFGATCNHSNGLCTCEDGALAFRTRSKGPTKKPCGMIFGMDLHGPHPPSNHSAPTQEINLKYYPDDSQVSIWMYAMISIGTAFVIFVVVTVYLMCSPDRE